MAQEKKVLLLTSDPSISEFFADLFKGSWFELVFADDEELAAAAVMRLSPSLVLVSIDEAPSRALISISRMLVQTPIPILLVTRKKEKNNRVIISGLKMGAVDNFVVPAAGHSISDHQRQLYLKIIAGSATTRISAISRKDVSNALEFGKRITSDFGSSDRESFIADEHQTTEPEATETNGHCGYDVVGIAISTGGPSALESLVPALPGDFPAPILIVQHIIPGFLANITRRLDSACAVGVKLAEHDEPLKNGSIYFAPDGYHLKVRKKLGRLYAELDTQPSNITFRPSADIMLQSIADCCGRRSLGVIMTGMGRDGVEGLRAIRDAGGVTIAQDMNSSAVYGMAKVAVNANIVKHILPLDRIAPEIVKIMKPN